MKTTKHLVLATIMIAWIVTTGTTAAQNQATPPVKRVPSRTVDSQPDMQGFWGNDSFQGAVGVAYDIEKGTPSIEHVINGGKDQPPPKVVVSPPVPYRDWALVLRNENTKNAYDPTKPEHIDSLSRCFQQGVPRQNFFGGFQILQVPGFVVIVYDRASRVIPLDGRHHIGESIKLWIGDSVGRWEGNTLAVDVTNINEYAWYDVAGNFHSNELHLTERWTLVDADTIDYEVVNDDPRVFTRPWTMKTRYVRNKDASFEQWENACYEGERDVDVMLKRNTR